MLKNHLIDQNLSKDNNSSFPDSLVKNNLDKVKNVWESVELKNSVIIFNKSDLKIQTKIQRMEDKNSSNKKI